MGFDSLHPLQPSLAKQASARQAGTSLRRERDPAPNPLASALALVHHIRIAEAVCAGFRLRLFSAADRPSAIRGGEGASAPRDRRALALDLACNGLFLLLIALNVARTLRHAMWRDELQIFQLATGSTSLVELFHRLRYEAHAGLWDVPVWLVTRFTSDPVSMQILHAALAIGVWIVVYRWSPFSRAEKFLLLLSYFLFFEYFIISRAYVLVALLGLGFVALRHHQPQRVVVAWLMLGLLANLVMHATIWSIALAIGLVLEDRARSKWFFAGAAIYLACLAFGLATMIPAADYQLYGGDVRFDPLRLSRMIVIPLAALVPVTPDWIGAVAAFARGSVVTIPPYFNPSPTPYLMPLMQAEAHPLRLALVFAAPLAVCWIIARASLRTLEFAIAYVGILAFSMLWDYQGASRHHGIVFLALIAAAWLMRARSGGDGWSRATLRAVLAVSALGGLLTLTSEVRPFSQSRDTARWLRQADLADAFLIGSRDTQASAVAGYLARKVYYLECQCVGTFIVWNRNRQSLLSADQFRTRLLQAVGLAAGRQPILISNRELAPDALAGTPLSVTLLKAFDGRTETDERYWIYLVTRS